MAAHEALRAREQLLHRLAEALPVGVVQLTAQGDVAYRNHQVVELLGTDIAGVDELVSAVSAADQDRVRIALTAVLRGRDHAHEEVELGSQPGTARSWCGGSTTRPVRPLAPYWR
jgi:PAS domain-containing protein